MYYPRFSGADETPVRMRTASASVPHPHHRIRITPASAFRGLSITKSVKQHPVWQDIIRLTKGRTVSIIQSEIVL